jgi:hypothetical protein
MRSAAMRAELAGLRALLRELRAEDRQIAG